MSLRVQAVLFDLDGTLIDSAPDLADTANAMRSARGLEPVPFERLRRMVGAGARGMIGTAFGVAPGEDGFDALRDEFLERYAVGLLHRTRVFDGMRPVLERIEREGVHWGIVTNKAERFTLPVVRGLGLHERAKAVISGDTTPHAKPHPAPLLEAARRIGVAPELCVYIGDDQRDVLAGRSAGMATLVAGWGYLGEGEPIEHWGADQVIEDPAALLKWLGLA
jgi:N-acetyl-D-muramate 6-phosphate phosphatase